MRYVASYWIYIVHLPVVAALQVLVGDLPWHWSLKLPIILSVSLVVLFLSYHLMVRPTIIGQLLNGRKYPRRPRALPAARLAAADRAAHHYLVLTHQRALVAARQRTAGASGADFH